MHDDVMCATHICMFITKSTNFQMAQEWLNDAATFWCKAIKDGDKIMCFTFICAKLCKIC